MDNMFSASIGKLAEALSKAQAEMPSAVKDSVNPLFKDPRTSLPSKYADYSSLMEACREPLAKNSLSLCHPLENRGEAIVIHTVLLHSSGEWIRSELAITPAKKIKKELLKDPFQADTIPTLDSNAIGAAVQNGKRIALAALLGLTSSVDEFQTNPQNDPEGVSSTSKKDTSSKPKIQQSQPLHDKLGEMYEDDPGLNGRWGLRSDD